MIKVFLIEQLRLNPCLHYVIAVFVFSFFVFDDAKIFHLDVHYVRYIMLV